MSQGTSFPVCKRVRIAEGETATVNLQLEIRYRKYAEMTPNGQGEEFEALAKKAYRLLLNRAGRCQAVSP